MADCKKCRFRSVCKKRPKMEGATIAECDLFRNDIERTEPITNADRIRAMSDEELANFMVERNVNESTLQLFDKDYALTAVQIEALKQRLYCACMQWLKQPVEDANP